MLLNRVRSLAWELSDEIPGTLPVLRVAIQLRRIHARVVRLARVVAPDSRVVPTRRPHADARRDLLLACRDLTRLPRFGRIRLPNRFDLSVQPDLRCVDAAGSRHRAGDRLRPLALVSKYEMQVIQRLAVVGIALLRDFEPLIRDADLVPIDRDDASQLRDVAVDEGSVGRF